MRTDGFVCLRRKAVAFVKHLIRTPCKLRLTPGLQEEGTYCMLATEGEGIEGLYIIWLLEGELKVHDVDATRLACKGSHVLGLSFRSMQL